MGKPILCLDFDGVLHSYTSGWKGARNIPDPPVPGALEFVVSALDHFRVAIYSSRSHQFGGRRAMKKWLIKSLREIAVDYGAAPKWWRDKIAETAFADPWEDEVAFAAGQVVRSIDWPNHKPPAMVSLDDRALTFTGRWPDLEALRSFKPWNKK